MPKPPLRSGVGTPAGSVMSRNSFILWLTIFASHLLWAETAKSSELPEGWRFPTRPELEGNFIREKTGKDYVEVIADFNGDGIRDFAYLVKSTEFSGEAIVVKVSGNNIFEWIVLNQISWGEEYPNVSVAMGVELVSPGEYETACGKGYWVCKDHEVPLLKLELPAINYFRFESAASFFYWKKETEEFKRIWISD